jgi:group I intron endonuclease
MQKRLEIDAKVCYNKFVEDGVINSYKIPPFLSHPRQMSYLETAGFCIRNIKMNSGVYEIKNLVDCKRYIGQSIDLERREYDHFCALIRNYHYNCHLQNSFNKYGEKNFMFRVLLYCEPFELTKYEQFYVDKYPSEMLYNFRIECVDSPLGVPRSEETRKKISNSSLGKIISKETKRKLSISHLGRRASKETRKKISIVKMGHEVTKKTREKISKAHSGKTLTKEHREKLSKAHIGKTLTEEHKRKVGEAISGSNHWRWINISDEEIMAMKSLREQGYAYQKIADIFGVSRKTVWRRLNAK